jgi:hypothetical protein
VNARRDCMNLKQLLSCWIPIAGLQECLLHVIVESGGSGNGAAVTLESQPLPVLLDVFVTCPAD